MLFCFMANYHIAWFTIPFGFVGSMIINAVWQGMLTHPLSDA